MRTLEGARATRRGFATSPSSSAIATAASVVRGTFAGHYLDVDDVADAIGHDTAVGGVAAAGVGLGFGPPGVRGGRGRARVRGPGHCRGPRQGRNRGWSALVDPHAGGAWRALRRDSVRHP